MYQAGGKQYSEYSPINKRILAVFSKYILRANVTSIVEYILDQCDQMAPLTQFDVAGDIHGICPKCGGSDIDTRLLSELKVDYRDGYVCPVCGATYENRIGAQTCCAETGNFYICLDCGEVYMSEDDLDFCVDPSKTYEWWLVDDWVGEHLTECGECVIQTEEYTVWGRAIDPKKPEPVEEDEQVFTLACAKEILDGQKKSWANLIKE